MRSTLFVFVSMLLAPAASFAQINLSSVPVGRQIFHEKIIAQQTRADRLDGAKDGFIKLDNNEEVNLQITDALIRRVDELRKEVEENSKIATNNDKLIVLRSLEFMVRDFIEEYRKHEIPASAAPALVDNFAELLHADINGKSILPIIQKTPWIIGHINVEFFTKNEGFKAAKIAMFRKFADLFPDKILAGLEPFVDEPFADSMIIKAYNSSPSQLYSFAQSTSTKLGRLIHLMEDPRIKMVLTISQQQRALFYFPFLDDLVHGRKTLEQIAKVAGTNDRNYDSVGYYKMMVKTAIDYHGRILRGDTPVALNGANGLLDMLQRKALEHFISPINELHERPNPIRFRALDPLSAQDLYYMMVLGENDIYTSSYKYSFDRMIQKMGNPPHGDSLLVSVNFDKFKKFIKMAAGYAKLDEFLRTMPQNADKLMQAFVAKLETSNSLEDAVDVADSYGSVSPDVQKSMLQNVISNEQRCMAENNSRGTRIYNLLKTIFLSADPKNGVDLSKEIGIPPIYTVDNKYLADDSGRIIEQVFFYGDDDGKISFASYMTSFPASDWKIVRKKEWVEIKSIKAKRPIWIYANLPLDNDTDKDAAAQSNLIEYMETNGLIPSIVIHRGHSYHLPYTIDQLSSNAKIIMLGSCGGYQNLKNILKFAPDAHIISTKQTGTTVVNKTIIDALDNTLRDGKNIDWRQMWGGLSQSYSHAPKEVKETFEDYIPPQKNLGALFIKAYTKLGGNVEE